MPGPEMDDILDDLRARARSARDAQEQLARLLDAVVAFGSDLELPLVLSRIVNSACELVDARYGALGVLSPEREHLVEFITAGITDAERAAIGDPPHGRGVLGLLIHEPHPVRLPDIGAAPESSGFPANHPTMHSFVGAPVAIRGEVFGNLYLAEKRSGAEFTEDDEAILVALAGAAGVAIENARLYEQSRHERVLSDAVAELTQHLLEGSELDAALRLLARRSAELSHAALAVVVLFDEFGRPVVRATNDNRPEHAVGRELGKTAVWQKVVSSREPVVVTDHPGEHAAEVAEIRALGALQSDGSTALFAIAVGGAELGVLAVAWETLDEAAVLGSYASLQSFGRTAALALEAATAQRDRGRMTLLEERERIARDMHDHVIQRLFATGLSLQSMTRIATDPGLTDRLDEAVDAIDGAIKDIRYTIFALQRPMAGIGLRTEVEQLVRQTVALGIATDLDFDSQVMTLSPEMESDLLAVIREALSNVARHAQATTCDVHVRIDHQGATVEVGDDGVGMAVDSQYSGLANLRHRALGRGGQLTIEARSPTGTQVNWQVPMQVNHSH